MTENFNYSKTVQVFSGRSYDDDFLPDNLAIAIVWLQAKLSSVPAEFRDKATIELEGDYDGGSPTLTIEYQRPPTDDEVTARRAEYHKRLERDVEVAKARVVQEEQRLAAFGGAA